MDKSTNFAETKKGDRKMKYSRNQINKAGDSLINDPFGRQQAVEIVTDWRQLHLPVLRVLFASHQADAVYRREATE